MLTDFENLEFQIANIFKTHHDEGCFCVPPRDFAALSIRLKGSARFQIEGKTLQSEPGDIIFVPEDTPYEVEYSVSEMIVVHFKSFNYRHAERFTPKNSELAKNTFFRLLSDWNDRHSANAAKAQIYGLLDALATADIPNVKSSTLLRCIAYMEAHFHTTETDIDSICKALYISRSTLQREFAKHLAISPQQYLIQMRLKLAFKLLSDGRSTVKEIADQCGFADDKYFSRSFKKAYGMTPSDVKRHIHI